MKRLIAGCIIFVMILSIFDCSVFASDGNIRPEVMDASIEYSYTELCAEYYYSHPEYVLEGETEYRWYISDDFFDGYEEIESESGKRLPNKKEYCGRYIRLGITPVDKNGNCGDEFLTEPVYVKGLDYNTFEEDCSINDYFSPSNIGSNVVEIAEDPSNIENTVMKIEKKSNMNISIYDYPENVSTKDFVLEADVYLADDVNGLSNLFTVYNLRNQMVFRVFVRSNTIVIMGGTTTSENGSSVSYNNKVVYTGISRNEWFNIRLVMDTYEAKVKGVYINGNPVQTDVPFYGVTDTSDEMANSIKRILLCGADNSVGTYYIDNYYSGILEDNYSHMALTDANNIYFDFDMNNVRNDIDLPNQGSEYGSGIVWVSSDEGIIGSDGVVVPGMEGSVVLTAYVICGSERYVREFEIYIISETEEEKLLREINNSPSWIELKDIVEPALDMLGIDVSRYDRLNNKNELYKALSDNKYYKSIEEFRVVFEYEMEDIIKNESSRPTGGSGGGSSGGGGGGYSNAEVYITDAQGNCFEQEPEDGTPVKLTVKMVYLGEPSIVYGIGIYNNGGLITAGYKESKALELYETEFFEIETQYYSDMEIKLFRLESITSLKPLESVDYMWFDFGREIPSPETETEGVIAVKGMIVNELDTGIQLMTVESRQHGYWGAPGFEEPVVVNHCFGPEIELYYSLGTNMVYNLRQEPDGSYSLDSIEYEDGSECVRFAGKDIVSYTANTITIKTAEGYITYEASEFINFNYENLDDEYYFAYMTEGKIEMLISYHYDAARVVGIGGGKLCLDNGAVIYNNDCTADINDIVVVYRNQIYDTEPVEAQYIAQYIEDEYGYGYGVLVVGDKEYDVGSARTDCALISGVTYNIYLDPEGRYVLYVDSNYTADDICVINGFEVSISGAVINTQNGPVALKDNVVIDGIWYDAMDAVRELECHDMPMVAFVTETDDLTVIDYLKEITRNRLRYIKATKSLGGYCISDAPVVAISNEDRIIAGAELTDNNNYDAVLYSANGYTIDFVLVTGISEADFGTEKYMILTDWSDGVVYGYSEGELVSYEADFEMPQLGNVYKLSVADGGIVSARLVMEPLNHFSSLSEYVNGTNVILPVRMVSGNIIYLGGESAARAVIIDENTDIYVMNRDEYTIEKAGIEDIFYNVSGDVYSTDWIATYYKGNTSEFIIISK